MKIYILIFSLLATTGIYAQSGIDKVLSEIMVNNKTLQSYSSLVVAQKLQAQTGNYLPNPTVELNQLWGSKEEASRNKVQEIAVVQSFDFPSVYTNKNKVAELKSETYDFQYDANRQQILLTAKQTCLEIIHLRKQKELLDNRMKNAGLLSALYEQRLKSGDANQIEFNKIELEKINVQNESRLNTAALQAKSEQLQSLNGGIPVTFDDTDYNGEVLLPEYAKLEAEYLALDPTLKSLTAETMVAKREIKLTKAQTLPKFDLGFRRNGGNEKANGFVIGLSIPMWENKNSVKQARAQAEYAMTAVEDNTQTLKSTLRELYTQAEALRNSNNEYAKVLGTQRNMELLNKALEAGQFSMIDYFVEMKLFYDSMQSFLNVEKEYQNTVAQLLQYKL